MSSCTCYYAQDISVLEKKLIEHEDAGKQPLLIVAYAGQLIYLVYTCIYTCIHLQHSMSLPGNACNLSQCIHVGTPLAGHIEDLLRIREITTDYEMWLHVQGLVIEIEMYM